MLAPPESDDSALPFNRGYVAVYGHNFSGDVIKNARQWAKHRRIPLISVGYRNDWANKQWLTAGPFEFAAFMEKSSAVITNFFQGCIFALNNSKSFFAKLQTTGATK